MVRGREELRGGEVVEQRGGPEKKLIKIRITIKIRNGTRAPDLAPNLNLLRLRLRSFCKHDPARAAF